MKGRLIDAVPLSLLSGVGVSLSAKLSKIGLVTVQDLLFHFPLRYENRTQLYSIAEVIVGSSATVQAKILHCEVVFGRRRMMICQVSDNTGILTLRFFNFNASMKNSLSPGRYIKAYGEVKPGKNGPEIIHPEYSLNAKPECIELEAELTAVYSTTEGLRQTVLRNLIGQALDLLTTCAIPELLPEPFNQHLFSLPAAIKLLHRPPPNTDLAILGAAKHPAQRRLLLEELIAHNLSMLAIRQGIQNHQAYPLVKNDHLKQQLLASLPFVLTDAQNRVITDIEQDLAKSLPMMRLVQGDVGSGKTLVAAIAALCAIADKKQVALMVPTELLAEQHVTNFRQWFEPLGIRVGWLTGKQQGKARQQQLAAIADGSVAMIVGTHAIFQDNVKFAHLTMIIIDEQHRFGVHQRFALWEKGQTKGYYPHQLIMTATPIPRTLAMTAYADLDTSVIDELPPGRSPVTTVAIPDSRRGEIIQRIKQLCKEGLRQVYWVCTLIEESDVLAAQAAEVTAEDLRLALTDLKIGLLHGRMKTKEKQDVMQSFIQGELQLLVATTVIEVGVDVANASMMIIENPERLGLAQLHQLRGRVGRGAVASHCVLLYRSPLSQTAQKRLNVLRDSNDGFVIAQLDLEIRGSGELLGTKQTGSVEFNLVDLVRDEALIPEALRAARFIHQRYPANANALIERWLPEKSRYSRA